MTDPDLSALLEPCETARTAAQECVRAGGSAGTGGGETADADALCADAAGVLTALVDAARRPFSHRRAAGLRRLVEAGLTATVECAAECNMHAEDPLHARCGEACERAGQALRAALRMLTDDEIEEHSGAT